MAYQAKRDRKVVEVLELVDENGEVRHTIRVELDANAVVEKINRAYLDLVNAYESTRNIDVKIADKETVAGAYEELGKAIEVILRATFGDQDASTILTFYDSNYVEMVKEVIPFVTGVVVPKVREAAKEYKQQILNGYNRKARRSLFKRM